MLVYYFMLSTIDVPTVSSRQLKHSPAVIVHEGDNASIICEKPLNETTMPRWMLSGPQLLLNESVVLNDSVRSLMLNDGSKLWLDIRNFYETSESTNNTDTDFQLTVLSTKQAFSGLTVACGVWWEEGDVSKFYEQSAVLVVVPKSMETTGKF